MMLAYRTAQSLQALYGSHSNLVREPTCFELLFAIKKKLVFMGHAKKSLCLTYSNFIILQILQLFYGIFRKKKSTNLFYLVFSFYL